jgi:hypothetical protein
MQVTTRVSRVLLECRVPQERHEWLECQDSLCSCSEGMQGGSLALVRRCDRMQVCLGVV